MRYTSSIEGVEPTDLVGFFDGWPQPPTAMQHLEILRRSTYVHIAVDEESKVVGFITSISDGVLSAYIPLLEVRADARGRGIGSQLVRLMLDRLSDLYMVDLTCDPDTLGFYEHLGMRAATGASLRRPNALSIKANGGVASDSDGNHPIDDAP
ncbi:MAG TPA: GNAT family N-acetyltransferase [Actinomycetes bacterium]|nr:GNAT family N-acetyltransferase [Actinomycetes bacterium]